MKVIKKTLSSMSGISGLLAVAVFVLTLVAPVRAQEREYTTIAPPGSRSSTAFGINARGDVVGSFRDQSLVQHGFLLSKADDVLPLVGVFGLQCERETVEYRNIQIREMPSTR